MHLTVNDLKKDPRIQSWVRFSWPDSISKDWLLERALQSYVDVSVLPLVDREASLEQLVKNFHIRLLATPNELLRVNSELLKIWVEELSLIYKKPIKGLPKKLAQSPEKKLGWAIGTFLIPMLAIKAMVLFFGIRNAMSPDQGYQYGLYTAIFLLFSVLILFAWTRHNNDDGSDDIEM